MKIKGSGSFAPFSIDAEEVQMTCSFSQKPGNFLHDRIGIDCQRATQKFDIFLPKKSSVNTIQVVEKRYERSQYKAKFNEKAEFMFISEHFEGNLNAVVA